MCIGGGGASMGAPPAVAAATPPPPTPVDPAVLAARQNARDRAAQSTGRASTIATAAMTDDGTGNKKALLGT